MTARHDPLLPNAAIVARREYRDRTRSPLFIASTIVLMALALGVALGPSPSATSTGRR
jgi:ABC-type Na+ efflux pump permease subunit